MLNYDPMSNTDNNLTMTEAFAASVAARMLETVRAYGVFTFRHLTVSYTADECIKLFNTKDGFVHEQYSTLEAFEQAYRKHPVKEDSQS